MKFSRSLKRAAIATLYIALISLLFTGVYFAYIKSPETCFDNKQNQDETGADCGGVCQAVCKEVVTGEKFQVKEIVFVPGGNNRFDVLGKIYNPNDQAGASSFAYIFELKDTSGQILVSRSGTSFVLPQETKDIIELNLETEGRPVTVSLRISDIVWEKFSGYREKPSITIYQKRYNQIPNGSAFSEAYGLLSNESPYDFRSIVVKVILRDSEGTPLAFNTTEMRSVSSKEQRDFRLIWPTSFPGTVEKIDMEVDADVYHSDNFMEQYFQGGRFQEFTAPKGF